MRGKRKVHRRDLLAIAAILGAIFLFIDFRLKIDGKAPTEFDSMIQTWLSGYGHPVFIDFFAFITNFASWEAIVLLILICGFWLWKFKGDKIAAVILGLSAWGGYEVNHLLKILIARERPTINEAVDGVGYSFPSGHSMVGFVFYAMLTYFVIRHLKLSSQKKLAAVLFSGLFIFLVGFSRVVLMVHYPSDVAAGFAAGLTLSILFIWLYRWLRYHYENYTSRHLT